MTELSVVMISRNQEWNVARLIESVCRETDLLPGAEVVLVDSASTDRTTEIAACYPISVLRLRPEQRLTAAAGRYVGYKQTTGDLVLFLDGDMELCEGWLAQAIGLMQARPDIGAACGQVINQPPTSDTRPIEHAQAPGVEATAVPVRHGGGASLYRRSVLERVGSFNPYLYSDEEPELCLRIRHAGYRIVRLSRPIAVHYSAPAESLSTFLAKWRGNLWLGYGQNVRYFAGTPLLWAYLKERGWAVAPAVALGAGLVSVGASASTGRRRWVSLWSGSLAFLTIGIAVRKRSVKRALLVLLRRLFILDGTLRGLLLEPHDPAGYPAIFDIIR